MGDTHYSATAETASADESQEIQTALVRQGDITVSATGAGTVIPAAEVALSFQSGGELEELLVTVGEEVSSGDILARLDDSDAQQSITNAELLLAQATMQTDGSNSATGISYNDIAVEEAQINLEKVQAELEELLNWEVDTDDIAQAEANLTAAQASYSAALGQQSALSSNAQVASINLKAAQRELEDAQAAYNTAYDPGREWELYSDRHQDALEVERAAASSRLEKAQDNGVYQKSGANFIEGKRKSNRKRVNFAENTSIKSPICILVPRGSPWFLMLSEDRTMW